MGLVKHLALAAALVTVFACDGPTSSPPLVASVPIADHASTPKPGAPVDVSITTEPLADGRVRAVLTATPRVDAEAVELTLGTRHETLGATRAGQARQLVLDVPAG